MLVMVKTAGDSSVLIAELEQLAELYRVRNRTSVIKALETHVEICKLVAKVSASGYPGIEKDLERLAQLFDARNGPRDAHASFHLRARAKRIVEAATQDRGAGRSL